MKPILILSGPVGAGKSTVARELVATAPGPVACIEGDIFWSFIAKGAESQPRNENFRMIMRSMIAAAMHYALADYEVILDFSIPPWFMKTARAVAKFKEVDLDYVVICPSMAVCAARAAARREGKIADYGPYRELYICFDEAPQHITHDEEGSVADIAAQIRAGLNKGTFRVP